MQNAYLLALAGISSFAVATALTPLVATSARLIGIVDLPNSRNVTTRPTPRVGGVAIGVAAIGISLLFFLLGGIRYEAFNASQLSMFAVMGGALLLLGLLDDVISLPSKVKLIALLGAAAAICAVALRIDQILLQGKSVWALGHATWPITILWIVAITVSMNFIDGLDGLAGGLALIAASVIAVVAVWAGVYPVALLAIALAGALCGFLVFNVHPARIFMGDCGSMFVGFSLAVLCVMLQQRVGATKGLLLPAIALAIPLLDTLLTFVRRGVIDRRSIFRAERGHIHHRLMDQQGLRHPHAVLVLLGVSLMSSILGGVALMNKGWGTVVGLLLLIPLLIGLFRIAGSVRLRHTLAAVRRNRHASGVIKSNQAIFDETQNRFRMARDFDAWWRTLCEAATELRCLSVHLPLTRRDGTTETMIWRNESLASIHDAETAMHATVPVPQRRVGGAIRAEVVFSAVDGIETAGQRLAMFSRLLAEHGLDSFPVNGRNRAPSPRLRLVGMGGSIDVPSVARAVEALQAPSTPSRSNPRVAIIHDFLYTYAGAEKVLEQIVNVYPDAEIFSLFDFLPDENRGFLQGKKVHTTFIQRLPWARSKHRLYLPLMPLAIEQLDLTGFDIVVSSSYLAAKGVITKPSQLHVCYCHSPARYAWDLQHQYLKTSNMATGLKSLFAKAILHYLRIWDVRSANGVDHFVTNSDFVGRRVEKIYRRKSTTIYPPVDLDTYSVGDTREDFYLAASRLVPYKRMDVIIDAFRRMPSKRLVIVGDGPEYDRLKSTAPANVKLVGHAPQADLTRYMQMAKGFIFAAEEDFGIVLVEAHACGTPAIAFGRGGAREIVIENETGVFFHRQRAEDVVAAIQAFESRTWDADRIRRHAEQFNASRFRNEMRDFVNEHWQDFADRLGLEASQAEQQPGDEQVASA